MEGGSKTVILLAEDDAGHSSLIVRNLRRAGVHNPIQCFTDGQALLDFLFCRSSECNRQPGTSYVLLLDIRMPGLDGVGALKQIKADPELRKMPVIMLTTTDDPREVTMCHDLGCSLYVTKPVEYGQFTDVVKNLGSVLAMVQVPRIDGLDTVPASA